MKSSPDTALLRLCTDSWLLWYDACTVITLRSAVLALGGPKAQREAVRMVSEKLSAASTLGEALAARGVMNAEAVASGTLAHYGSRVRANRRRLSRPA